MTTIEKIEEFFGAKFRLLSDNPDSGVTPEGAHLRELLFFDGFVHWHLVLDTKKQMLWMTSADTPGFAGAHFTETAVFFAGALLEVDSWKSVLKIQPNNTSDQNRFLWLTRYDGGRIYMAFAFGDEPDLD